MAVQVEEVMTAKTGRNNRIYTRRTMRERFMDKFEPCPATGCWMWTGTMLEDGYGRIRDDAFQNVRAHRAAWSLFVGPIPEGLWVLHYCDVPLCVNPSHLWLGTSQENTADRQRKGRWRVNHAS